MTASTSAVAGSDIAARYFDIVQFLALETRLLDENRLWEWYKMLDDDFVYEVPIRIVQERSGADEFPSGSYHMRDTKGSVKKRIERLDTGHAWAEDPASRTVRVVGIPLLESTDDSNVVIASSSLLVYRERAQDPAHDLISGRREDLIRFTDGEPRLAARTVRLAHTSLNTSNLGIFL